MYPRICDNVRVMVSKILFLLREPPRNFKSTLKPFVAHNCSPTQNFGLVYTASRKFWADFLRKQTQVARPLRYQKLSLSRQGWRGRVKLRNRFDPQFVMHDESKQTLQERLRNRVPSGICGIIRPISAS